MSDTGQNHLNNTGGMAAQRRSGHLPPPAPPEPTGHPNMAERSLSLVQTYDIDKRHPVRHAQSKPETEPERMKGVIYITGHRFLGVGPYHTAIEFTPHGSDDTAWISAGPEDGRLVGGIGTRTNRVRESDAPKKNRVFGIIIPPPGVTAHAHFERLKASSLACVLGGCYAVCGAGLCRRPGLRQPVPFAGISRRCICNGRRTTAGTHFGFVPGEPVTGQGKLRRHPAPAQ